MDSLLEEAGMWALGGRRRCCRAQQAAEKASAAFSVGLKAVGASGGAPLWICLHEEQLSLLGKRKKIILRQP